MRFYASSYIVYTDYCADVFSGCTAVAGSVRGWPMNAANSSLKLLQFSLALAPP